jgi:hypothetical protein
MRVPTNIGIRILIKDKLKDIKKQWQMKKIFINKTI